MGDLQASKSLSLVMSAQIKPAVFSIVPGSGYPPTCIANCRERSYNSL